MRLYRTGNGFGAAAEKNCDFSFQVQAAQVVYPHFGDDQTMADENRGGIDSLGNVWGQAEIGILSQAEEFTVIVADQFETRLIFPDLAHVEGNRLEIILGARRF